MLFQSHRCHGHKQCRGRFPNPHCDYAPYVPTKHCVNVCGEPRYHEFAFNSPHYGNNPMLTIHPHHMHHLMFQMPEHDCVWCGGGHFGTCGHDEEYIPAPFRQFHDFEYLAPTEITNEKNTINVYFPAHEQVMCGTYRLVIVLVMYEAGWGRCNLHTYTIDKGQVLRLTNYEGAQSGDINIELGENPTYGSQIEFPFASVQSRFDTYYINPSTTFNIGDVDNMYQKYQIVLKQADGTEYVYNPDNWPYDGVTAEFTNITGAPAISVDKTSGAITASANAVGNQYPIGVTFYGKDHHKISIKFSVVILGDEYDYIMFIPEKYSDGKLMNRTDQGFEEKAQESANTGSSSVAEADNVSILEQYITGKNKNGSVIKYKDIQGKHTVTSCDKYGYFMWILSRKPIYRVYGDFANIVLTESVKVTFDGLANNLSSTYYAYCCPNPLQANTTFDINVQLEQQPTQQTSLPSDGNI